MINPNDAPEGYVAIEVSVVKNAHSLKKIFSVVLQSVTRHIAPTIVS